MRHQAHSRQSHCNVFAWSVQMCHPHPMPSFLMVMHSAYGKAVRVESGCLSLWKKMPGKRMSTVAARKMIRMCRNVIFQNSYQIRQSVATKLRDAVLTELTNMVPKITMKIKPSAKATDRSKYLSWKMQSLVFSVPKCRHSWSCSPPPQIQPLNVLDKEWNETLGSIVQTSKLHCRTENP